MTIDVSGILKDLGGRVDVDGEITIEDFDFNGSSYSMDAPVRVRGSVANNGKALVLRADAEAAMRTQCARCLKDIVVDASFSMEESFVRSEDADPSDEESIVFDGSAITLDDAVEDSLVMNIRGRYLCSEDCRGLCPSCGKDLNEGECECGSEFIDPRWAGLADLMKENNLE